MTTEVITYESDKQHLSKDSTVLEFGEKDGIRHVWVGNIICWKAKFTWNFDWKTLKSQGVDRLVGHLIVSNVDGKWKPHTINIDWTDTNQSISKFEEDPTFSDSHLVKFEYNLTAHYAELPPPEKISYDGMFLASDITDAILVVEGKKLNVNKTFLSVHSDYFKILFSEKFQEGQMKEIPLKGVSYEDFGLLLSSFYPNQQFPNDHTVEKLLEMASRFQVLSVIRIVEHHLLHHSKIRKEKMLSLADEYGMKQLLEKCVGRIDSMETVKKLKKSPEYEKLSVRTCRLIGERLLKIA
ncbi:unnamed protein product [Caenorhabditis nigoni]